MSVIQELIKVEEDGSLSFGDYLTDAKKKVRDFEVKGDIYYLKTYNEATRLEKNETLLFEADPGAAAHNFKMSEAETTFTLYGKGNTQIIVGLEPSVQYSIQIGGEALGEVKTTMSGKLIFSAELGDAPAEVVIKRA